MECRFAYRMKDSTYILCKELGEPKSAKMQDTAKCMCGHQRFCGKIQNCALLPTWRECAVRREAEEKAKITMDALREQAAIARVEGEARRRRRK